MKSLWSDFWNLFFPRCCLICGKRLLVDEEYLCLHCLGSLPRTRLHLCPDNEIEKGMWGKMPIERASAFLYYTKGGDVRKMLYELKYYKNQHIGRFMGRWMASELVVADFFLGVDYILPVPLHRKKQKERGFNQSEMLAEGISSVTQIPILREMLARVQYTETQTRKGNYERWMNVKEVFECVSPDVLIGKHVLLVDDVMTTGATIVACADALRGILGLKVSVLTFALARET